MFSSHKRTSAGRGLHFESLERRDVMAGNVTAVLDSGDLVITGDGAANGVVVTRVGPGAYEVRGTVHGGSDTRINDKVDLPKVVTGVTDDVIVNLKVGNDKVTFFGSVSAPFAVPDALVVKMDAGNDEVGMDFVKTGGNIEVNSGSGVDTFIAVGVNAGNNLLVQESLSPYYAGNSDFVNIYGGSRVGNQLNVKLNSGNDSFKTNWTTAKSLWIEGGAGNDEAFVDNTTVSGFMRFDPGTGSDTTTVQNSKIGDDLTITEASGTRPTTDLDRIFIGGNKVTDLIQIDGNRGREDVRIDSTAAERLFARLGAGNDSLNIKSTTIRGAWILDGGLGSDSLNRYKNNKSLTSSNFESYSSLYL